jgi:hypothetical protein
MRSLSARDAVSFAGAAIVAGLVVSAVAAAAGFARILPTLLDPAVPGRAARPFVAGLLALSFEIGALVGWPLGWVEAATRSRERGEARARMSLGEGPWRRIARMTPAIVVLALLGTTGSLAWGRDARSPGRVARALIEEVRLACVHAADTGRTTAIAVPLVHATWMCRPGHAPLLLGEGAGNASAIDFVASSLDVSDDLSSISARDAQILVPSSTPTRLRVGEARVVGLVPFSAPSSVPPLARAAAIVVAALLSAAIATVSALRGEVPVRAGAWAIALAGPSATLAVLRACEQAHVGDARLVVIPLAAAASTLFARIAARAILEVLRRRRSPRRAVRA